MNSMVIGFDFLVQVDHDIFNKCKTSDETTVEIPSLGSCIFRGDYVTLQDKATGEVAKYEVIRRPTVKRAEDKKTVLAYMCALSPVAEVKAVLNHC